MARLNIARRTACFSRISTTTASVVPGAVPTTYVMATATAGPREILVEV
jgi:hypothetical protein